MCVSSLAGSWKVSDLNDEGEGGGPRDGGEDNDETKEKRDVDSVDVSNTNVHGLVDAYVNAK